MAYKVLAKSYLGYCKKNNTDDTYDNNTHIYYNLMFYTAHGAYSGSGSSYRNLERVVLASESTIYLFNPLAEKFSRHTRQKLKRHERSRNMCTLLIGQNISDQSEPCRSDLKTTWWQRLDGKHAVLMDMKLYKWLVMV